jgi:homoserine kinase type II
VQRLCAPYGLESRGFSVLSGGLINTNIEVATDHGPVLLRVYVGERTRPEVEFEMSVLERLSGHGLQVQRPRRTRGGELVGSFDDRQYAVLDFVLGHTMEEDGLNDELSTAIGTFVGRMHAALEGFEPLGSKPDADVEFIDRELVKIAEIEAGWNGVQDLWPQVRDYFRYRDLQQGVVHADIYPGNIIVDDSERLSAVIDFDDCYWGTILFDLSIAAMAFSFKGASGDDWRRAWLTIEAYCKVRGAVELDDVYWGMIANCVRFYVYTLPLTRGEGLPAWDNPFAIRAQRLLDPQAKDRFLAAQPR